MNLLSITNAFIRMIKHRMLVESTTSFLLCITQGNRKIQILSMLFARDQKREGKVESQGKTLLVMTKNADRVCLFELSINVSNFRDHSMYHRNPIKYPTCAL